MMLFMKWKLCIITLFHYNVSVSFFHITKTDHVGALNESIFLSAQMYRESAYQVLSQTTPENTSKNYASYSINPKSRYTRVNLSSILSHQVRTVILYLHNTDLKIMRSLWSSWGLVGDYSRVDIVLIPWYNIFVWLTNPPLNLLTTYCIFLPFILGAAPLWCR